MFPLTVTHFGCKKSPDLLMMLNKYRIQFTDFVQNSTIAGKTAESPDYYMYPEPDYNLKIEHPPNTICGGMPQFR